MRSRTMTTPPNRIIPLEHKSRPTLVPTCTIKGSEVLTKIKHELSVARNNDRQALSKAAYAGWAHRS